MEKSELAMLLTFVHSVQGGEPNDLEVEAWHELIGDLDYETCRSGARRFFSSESRRIWPADLRKLAPKATTNESPYNDQGQLVVPRGMRVMWDENGRFSHFEPRDPQ